MGNESEQGAIYNVTGAKYTGANPSPVLALEKTAEFGLCQYISCAVIRSKMCNELECAIQSAVDLININITRDVQEECANRLYWVCTVN